ncbi:MAG: ABC transporter permease subunit [Clostridia bacterium]|nr:ABC transporter permease subunit [Clostridia bacterium]
MLNPILASSMRRRMRTVRTPVILTLYALLPLVFAASSVFAMSKSTLVISQMRNNVDQYIILTVLQFFLVILVAPAMTAGCVSGERERQTLELLLVTNTGSLRIVLGKLMEAYAYLALVVLSGLPMTCVVLAVGGLSLRLALFSLLFLLVCAFAAASVGLFASSLFNKTVAATVTAYLIVFAIGIVTLIPLFMGVSQAIHELYDGNAAQTLSSFSEKEIAALIPPLLYMNPGLGLFALLMDQTGLLNTTFSSLGYGYFYFDILSALSFRTFTLINMGVMLVLSLILIGLSALLVRPRRHPSRPGRKKQ